MKNWTTSDQYFQRVYYQKIDVRNYAEFSSTAQLQISFEEIILRHPVELSYIENKIFITLKVSHIFVVQPSSNGAVAQLVSYPYMGVCAGRCSIPTFTGFNLRDFFFAKSNFNINFGSETFRSFKQS